MLPPRTYDEEYLLNKHSRLGVLSNELQALGHSQRFATKVTVPLEWTNTCCSHPLYRESELIDEECLGVRNAAKRKLLDELGIHAEDVYKAPSDGTFKDGDCLTMSGIISRIFNDEPPIYGPGCEVRLVSGL
ncbi:PREDICTED: isopentenyl-diphosphate Delta-isomerase I-like [Fragaria vesca subsp. vesca]